MKTSVRLMVAVLALAAAGLACNLPIRDAAPELPLFSATPAQAVVEAASLTPPPQINSPEPSATPLLPTVTLVNQQPAATLTFTPTATATTKPTDTRVPASPTPPPTVTPKPERPTATNVPAPSRVTANAQYFSSPIVLDGIWDEWRDRSTEYPIGAVVWGRQNWEGDTDLEGSYRVGWDETSLYLAVKIKDDVYAQNTSGDSIYLGDSLEILFDANLMGDLGANSLSGDDYQLGISPGSPDVDGAAEAYLWFPRSKAGSRGGVQIAAVRQDGVTRIEAIIPWSVFGVSPRQGARYGFAVSISDNDNSAENVQQSMVSNAPGRVLVDPTTWGELRLK